MKKLKVVGVLIGALAFGACSTDYEYGAKDQEGVIDPDEAAETPPECLEITVERRTWSQSDWDRDWKQVGTYCLEEK